MEFAVLLGRPEHYTEYGKEKMAEAVKKAEGSISKAKWNIRRFREEESSVYMDYHDGKILQKDYVAFKMKQADRLEELQKQQEEWEKEKAVLLKQETRYLAAIKALLKLKSGKELTKDMAEAFISRIYVYPGKRIEVLFTVTADSMKGVG